MISDGEQVCSSISRARSPWSPVAPAASAAPSAWGSPSAGADVAVNYHVPPQPEFGHDNRADAEQVAAEIRAKGRRALAVQADVASKAQVEAMIETTVRELGGLDILVNNAGICPFHEFLTMPEELWDRVHAVNLKGAFLCSQAAAKVMIEQGRGGRIISISSISALVGGALQTHYTPTKAGVHSLMQSLAIVLGPHGITCNSVMPGAILTDINKDDSVRSGKTRLLRAARPGWQARAAGRHRRPGRLPRLRCRALCQWRGHPGRWRVICQSAVGRRAAGSQQARPAPIRRERR
ncbi:MAG: hypothetical protein KatS3mg059_0099 [Thermomicrobiales bacterium]|nr:MAG: hypothetical protein KatS3mg059_0099 [Thermomicrobiales bacterium]